MLSEVQKLRKEKHKAEEKGEWREAAAICNCIGQELVKLGKYEEAKNSHFEELRYCGILKDELGKAVANRKIGECYAEMNDFKRALHHQTIFLDIAVREKSLVEEQRAWATLGRTYFIKYLQENDYNLPKEVSDHSLDQAERSFHKALKLADSIKSEISPKEYEEMRARLLLNIGLVYEQRNNLDKCSDIIRHAIFLSKKNNLYEDLHRCQYSLASVYQRCKQHELALRILDEAISSAKALKNKSYLCEALSAKANVLLMLKDFEAAKSYLKKAYKIRSPIEDEQEKIEKTLKIVLSLCESERKLSSTQDPAVRRPLLEKIADALASLGCYKISVKYYLLTLECLEKINAPSSEKATILYSVAQTYADDGNYTEAMKYLQRELDYNQNRPVEQVKTLWKMADVTELQENIPGVEIMLLKALNLSERLEHKKSIYLSLKRLCTFYESNSESLKMAKIEERLNRFEDMDSDEEEEEIMETERLFEEVELSELLSDSSDSENEYAVVRKFKRSNKLEAKRNELGETVLHRACIAGKLNLVEQLVENGHSVNVRDNCGWSPLHEACNHGYYEIVEYLISKGAHINDRGGDGCRGVTPLIDAASCGNLDVMDLLIRKGASVTLTNDNGNTALDELIKWRERCAGDLDDGIICQSKEIEAHLKSLMKQSGCKAPSLDISEYETGNKSQVLSESLWESTPSRTGRTNEKRTHSSSSSDDDVYGNPHLDWDKENDFSNPQKVKSDYQAVMSSIRHNVKLAHPPEPVTCKESLPALLEEHGGQGWLIQDVGSKNKLQKKKKKQRKASSLVIRSANHRMDRYLSTAGSDSDSRGSSSTENNDRSSYKISADESSVGESPAADSQSTLTEFPQPFSVRVKVTDKIIFVPIIDETLTIDWLAKETANRFQNLVGKKPVLSLMKKDGAYLCSTDVIRVVLHNNEELVTSVNMWEQIPLLETYKQNCAKVNLQPNKPVENRLQPFEITSELNFSDICLPSSQLMVLFKSLDASHRLTHLNLSNNVVEAVLNDFISCISSFQSLVILNLSCCGLTTTGIKDIAKCFQHSTVTLFPRLQQLYLSYNLFGPKAAKPLATILSLLDLRVLKLRACDITEEFFADQTFCDSLSHAEDMKELDMSNNDINSVGISQLLASLPRRNLTKLDLSRTMTDGGDIMIHLCRYFSHSVPHLQEIHLESCCLNDSDIILLSESVKFCPKLSHINLSSNIGLSGQVFLKLVESSHAHNVPLAVLHAIDCCSWNEETVKCFCKVFQARILRNIVLDCIPKQLYNEMFNVWKGVWGTTAISCNDMICEFSTDRFSTLKDYPTS